MEEKKRVVKQVVKSESGGKESTPKSGFKEAARDIGESLLTGVIVPAAKDMLYDFIVGGASMSIYHDKNAVGRSKRRPSNSGSNSRYTSYNSITDGRGSRSSDSGRYAMNTRGVNVYYPPNLTRDDCYAVIDELKDQIEEYGYATVSDYYQAIGHTGRNPRMEQRWGWEDLDGIRPEHDPDINGYYIPFPREIAID